MSKPLTPTFDSFHVESGGIWHIETRVYMRTGRTGFSSLTTFLLPPSGPLNERWVQVIRPLAFLPQMFEHACAHSRLIERRP
jgi:hypothetical protein